MAGRGRHPYEITDATPFGLPNPRLKPPASLSEPEKQAFLDLITACPASQFTAADLPLLARWSELVVMAETAAAEMTAGGMVTVDRKVSPWVTVHEKATKGLVALALRLRLGPQSRAFKAPKRTAAPTSYYDRAALLEAEDEDEAGEAKPS